MYFIALTILKYKTMKKNLLFLAVTLIGSTVFSQTVLFQDDFESYDDFIIADVGDWTMVDLDGLDTYYGGTPEGEDPNWANATDPKAFMIFNTSTANVSDDNNVGGEEVLSFEAHSGNKYLAAWAANPGDGNLGNDDWAISPAIQLGSSDNTVEMYVKALSNTYGNEPYTINVYVGSDVPSPNQFIQIGSGMATYPSWELISYDLDAYANQTVRIGIHYIGVDVYMFMVDDFKVTTSSMSVSDVKGKNVTSVYPNPAVDVVNINLSDKFNADKASVSVVDMNGKVVAKFASVDAVNVQALPKGVYVLEITDGKLKETKKLIKK